VIDFDNRFASVGAWDGAAAPLFADLPAGARIVSLAQTLGMGARVRQTSLGFPFRVWARREIECPPNTSARSEEGILWAAVGSTAVLAVIAGVATVAFRDAVVAALVVARSRRGACRACDYDLAGAPAGVCPECGTEQRP